MGTNTDFTGAIRITPCVEEPLATRLKQFMDIRHMKRNVKTLHSSKSLDTSRKTFSYGLSDSAIL